MLLFAPATRLIGLYMRIAAVRNEKNSPGVIAPANTLEPPYHTIAAVPITPTASNTGAVRAETCVVFMQVRK